MDTLATHNPGRALRTLNSGIRIARFALVIFTVLASVYVAMAVLGRGTMTVEGDLEQPYTVEFADGRRVGISGTITTYEDFEIGRERDSLADVDSIGVTINVSRNDTDARLALGAMVAGWLVAAWIGLLGLSRVVGSAMDGRPFADGNPALLRQVGAALIAVPLITVAGGWVVDRTLDTDIPVSVTIGGSVWLLAAVGLAVLALAEVFAEAARLREFEEATI